MRLPGTINIVNNDLPTTQFLANYQIFKQRQRAASKVDLTNNLKNGASNGKPINGKKISATDKANGNTSGKADGSCNGNANSDSGFTIDQDDALIEMKATNTPWKQIAVALGKDIPQIKQRFGEIKPADFDKRCRQAQDKKKEEKQQGGAGVAGNYDKKEEQVQVGTTNGNDGGKKGKKNKGKWMADIERDDSDEEGGDEWWEQPDDNWSKDEVCLYLLISFVS
jgi:hypothetical protein